MPVLVTALFAIGVLWSGWCCLGVDADGGTGSVPAPMKFDVSKT